MLNVLAHPLVTPLSFGPTFGARAENTFSIKILKDEILSGTLTLPPREDRAGKISLILQQKGRADQHAGGRP